LCAREGYLSEGESLPSYYERRSILHLPTLTAEELEREYDRFQELKAELRMKKETSFRHRMLRFLSLAQRMAGRGSGRTVKDESR
jgi:hypothetical protein